MPDSRLLTEEEMKRWRQDTALWTGDDYLWVNRTRSLLGHIAALSERLAELETKNERLRDVLEQIGYGSEARENASLTRRQIENIARAALDSEGTAG